MTTSADGDSVVDVTAALPWPHDTDPLTAGWWRPYATTADMLTPVPAIVACASSVMTLLPGDVLFTGGAARGRSPSRRGRSSR